jgi:Cu-Zn family superoxide dismutase
VDDGTAAVETFNTQIDGEAAPELFDDDGAAPIVHAAADTYEGDADAGDRIACGVIEPAERQ